MATKHIHIYIGPAVVRKTNDVEYSKYHQAMEATKIAQGLVDKIRTPSSIRKSTTVFREASQACKKAADLWGKAATENPQFKTNYLAAESKWNSEAVELGRRAVGDGGGLTDMDAEEVMDKYGATFLAKVRNQGSAKAPDGKTIRKAGSRFTADASSVAAAEKAIATQQRLIDGCVRNGRNVPPILQQRLAFLKELDKLKMQTRDNDFAPGDRVHLGMGAPGGAGVKGRLEKIEGSIVYVKNQEGRTFRGLLRNLTKDAIGEVSLL